MSSRAEAAARPPGPNAARRRLHAVRPVWLLGAAMLVAFVALLYAGRGIGFFYDEWSFVIERHEWTLGTFLEPHNEHLSLLPVAVYKLMFLTVGLHPHWPYLVVLLLLHLLTAWLVYALARRRIGDWAAVVAALPILLLGMAWEDLIWAFQIVFVGSVAAGLGALLALERGTRRSDAAASVLLAASLATSSLGLPFLIGIAAELAWQRAWRRLAVVVAAPAALYALWYLVYGKSAIEYDGIVRGVDWAVDAAAAAAGGLLGQGAEWGRPMVVLGGLALLWWVGSGRPLSGRLIGLLATAGSFWLLTGFARSSPGGAVASPESSRYVYAGAILIVLIAGELLRGARATPRALIVATLVAVLGILASVPTVRDGVQARRSESDIVRGELAAVDLLAGRGLETYAIDSNRLPRTTIGLYEDAKRAIGDSPAMTATELATARGNARGDADRVLAQAGGITLGGAAAATAPEPPALDGSQGGQVTPRGGCLKLDGAGVLDLTVPPSGLSLRAAGSEVVVNVRRFFDQVNPTPLGAVQPGTTTALVPLPDASPVPWHVRLTSDGAMTACTLQG